MINFLYKIAKNAVVIISFLYIIAMALIWLTDIRIINYIGYFLIFLQIIVLIIQILFKGGKDNNEKYKKIV